MSSQILIEKLCQLSHAESLWDICDLACNILGNPMHINSMTHEILAYTRCVEINDLSWQKTVVGGQLDRSAIGQNRRVNAIEEKSLEWKQPVLVTDGKVPAPRLIKALSLDGQPLGVMVVTSYLRPFEPGDAELMELISGFVANQFQKARGHIDVNETDGEAFFASLLDNSHYSKSRVERRMEALGYAKCANMYVLTICPEYEEREQAEEDLQPLLADLGKIPRSCSFIYNSMLVCVYGSEELLTDWEKQAPELTRVLRDWNLVAGVSRRVTDMVRLREHYHQSLETLKIGCRLKRHDSYYYYDNLASFLLLRRIPEADFPLFCHQKIQELNEYDRAHNTELCTTLQVYLEQTKSLVRTAEILFIHRNTVRYRINKCVELLGSDLNDGNEIFSFILSLRMLEYKTKILVHYPASNNSLLL